MAAELTAQRLRQAYREAEPRAAYAKSMNRAAHAPDADWRALVANPDHPQVAASAGVPVTAIAGWLMSDEGVVAMVPGKWFANRALDLPDTEGLVPLENSMRPSIPAVWAAHVNTIEALLERGREAPWRPGEP
jgi:hypothetical protein